MEWNRQLVADVIFDLRLHFIRSDQIRSQLGLTVTDEGSVGS